MWRAGWPRGDNDIENERWHIAINEIVGWPVAGEFILAGVIRLAACVMSIRLAFLILVNNMSLAHRHQAARRGEGADSGGPVGEAGGVCGEAAI